MLKKYVLLNEDAFNSILKVEHMKNLRLDGTGNIYIFDEIPGYPWNGFHKHSIVATSDTVYDLLTGYKDLLVFKHPDYDEKIETFVDYHSSIGSISVVDSYYTREEIIKNLIALLIKDPIGNFIRYNLMEEDI